MDAPPIQYARTADGVNIAYWTLGEGPPLLCTTWGSSPRHGWEFTAEWLSRLASRRRVIGFDRPGFGLSDPDGPFVTSPESLADCLDAVADAVGLSQFDLLSFDQAGPYALAYAANRPERVNRMVVWTGYASASEFSRNPDIRPYLRMAPVGSHGIAQYVETIMRLLLGKEHGALAEQLAAEHVETTNPDAMFAQTQAELDYDATPLLADITAPLLVLHREACRFFPVKFGRDIAAAVPGAQLTVIPGDSWAPFLPTPEPVLAAINAFLSDESEVREGPLAPGPFRTILFTDVVASTSLLAQLKDARMRAIMRDHDAVLQGAVEQHDGRVVKTIGDAFMADFAVPSAAVT